MGSTLKGFIINKSIEQVNGIQYEVNDLNLDEYGLAIVATNPTVSNGEFRRARAMLPFEYLDKKRGILIGHYTVKMWNSKKTCKCVSC